MSFDVDTHENITTMKTVNIYTCQPQKLFCLPSAPSFLFLPSTPLLCFLSLVISLHFLQFYVNGILLYALFLVWPLSLSIIILKFIQVVVCVSILKFYCWLLFHCMHGPQFLGCFQVWAMANKVAINNCIPVSMWCMFSVLLGIHMPGSGIAESYGNPV